MKRWVIAAVASAAFTMGFISSNASSIERDRPSADAPTAPLRDMAAHSRHGSSRSTPLSCAGGPEHAVRLEVVSAGAHVEAGALHPQYELSVWGNGLGSSAVMRYAVELVSDTGVEAMPTARSNAVDLTGNTPFRSVIDLPPALPTGFYLLRVTAAALGGSNEGSGAREVFLYSDGARVHEVSFDDWMTRSHAYEARRT